MRYYSYSLGIKHLLPKTNLRMAQGEQDSPDIYFHSVIPVGTAIIAADSRDPSIYLLHLIDCPEAFLYKIAFAINPPIDRANFLLMLESTGHVSGLLCHKRESVSLYGDASELFEYQRESIEIFYRKVSIALNYEVLSRN